MPDWFGELSTETGDPAIAIVAARLALAWLCGWIVAVIARRKLPVGSKDTLTLTLVLMCILIAIATQIIGDNIARAFSLVGALSIVRFRTAVPATRDVAFVLAAVVVGMAIGAGQYWITALGLLIVGLASHFNSPYSAVGRSAAVASQADAAWRLTLQVGLSPQSDWEPELEQLTESHHLISAESVRRGGAMSYVYRLSLKHEISPSRLIATINALPGIESVALKLI